MPDRVDAAEARRLLQAAYAYMATAPAWTVTSSGPDGAWVSAAVRPGLEWVEAPGGHLRALVVEGTAYVSGAMGLALLLGGPALDALGGPGGPGVPTQWVRVPVEQWRRKHGPTALGSVALDPQDDDLRCEDVRPADGGGRLVRLGLWGLRVTVHEQPDGVVRVVGQDVVEQGYPGTLFTIAYGDHPLALPDPHVEGVRTPAELLGGPGRDG